ncbi:MAG TPA: AarF/UbiB family protein, partial [Longimicrobiales bacterium]|nr:AarF/UbiB family protein [Longimicrobiales bacterium]
MIGNVAFVLVFAWAARAFLDARELTWRRLMLAALGGIALGTATTAFLLVDDVSEIQRLAEEDFTALSLPFVLIATMGAVVVLELLFSRPRRQKRPSRLHPLRSVRLAGGIVRRAMEVSRIMARNGLASGLGMRRGRVPSQDAAELARRARMALEEAGGMFIKLGQLLATRPDLVPPEAQRELARLHSSAAPLDRTTVERLIEEQLGQPVDQVFGAIDWEPLGSASIAQAHTARLVDGSHVVVKVRRPELLSIVARDLAITRWLARTAARRTTWGRALDVVGLAEEFAETLEAELDFRVEARSNQEVAEGAEDEPLIHVPRIYPALTSDGLLVMERLAGTPFSQLSSQDEFDGRALADALTNSQVGAMLQGKRFHGDPHPGNVLL